METFHCNGPMRSFNQNAHLCWKSSRDGELTPPRFIFPTPGYLGRGTYVDIVNVQDTRVELEAQSLGLLDRVGQLAVGLQQEAKMPVRGPPKPRPHHDTVPQVRAGAPANACPPWAGAGILGHSPCRQLSGGVSRFQLLHLPEMALVRGVLCQEHDSKHRGRCCPFARPFAGPLPSHYKDGAMSGLPNESGIHRRSRQLPWKAT